MAPCTRHMRHCACHMMHDVQSVLSVPAGHSAMQCKAWPSKAVGVKVDLQQTASCRIACHHAMLKCPACITCGIAAVVSHAILLPAQLVLRTETASMCLTLLAAPFCQPSFASRVLRAVVCCPNICPEALQDSVSIKVRRNEKKRLRR